jgi:hypothetical protein
MLPSHVVAGVRTVTTLRIGATAQKLSRLFAFSKPKMLPPIFSGPVQEFYSGLSLPQTRNLKVTPNFGVALNPHKCGVLRILQPAYFHPVDPLQSKDSDCIN